MSKCPKCGAENAEGNAFCNSCGAKTGQKQSASAAMQRHQLHIKVSTAIILASIVLNVLTLTYAVFLSSSLGGLTSKLDLFSAGLESLEASTSERMEGIKFNLTAAIQEVANTSVRQVDYTGMINKSLQAVVLVMSRDDEEDLTCSGFLISGDGYIITAYHCVMEFFGNESVTVRMKSGKTYEASIIDRDEGIDSALLKINVTNKPYLEFADSSLLKRGDKAFALGAPAGLVYSATEGVVSALRTAKEAEEEVGTLPMNFDDSTALVQTDAAITGGNSGGPLVDKNGRVIGLNSFGFRYIQGFNFAVASNGIREFYEEALE